MLGLTIEPFRVVFQGSFESVFTAPGGIVVEIRSENDGIGFGELGVGARVEGRQTSGVAMFHPHSRAVVTRIEWTLGDAHSDARNVFIPAQLSQIGLLESFRRVQLVITLRFILITKVIYIADSFSWQVHSIPSCI